MRFNKMPLIAAALFLVVAGIVASVVGGKEKSKAPASSPPVSARALVLTADRSRTVVVPPCNTPVSATASNAARGRPTPGATTVELPRGRGSRTLLVPHCQPAKTGSMTTDGGIPSAAFVLGGSKPLTKDREGKIESDGVIAESQLLLPDGSNTSTIVVRPCTKQPVEEGRDVVLSAPTGDSDLAVAPAC
jgi:hypothetical protein